ncbi:MAG: hypothetical protein KA391_00155 [Luteimonas sp.]|nr:hypothetical protein [Luteimonas sp.]
MKAPIVRCAVRMKPAGRHPALPYPHHVDSTGCRRLRRLRAHGWRYPMVSSSAGSISIDIDKGGWKPGKAEGPVFRFDPVG